LGAESLSTTNLPIYLLRNAHVPTGRPLACVGKAFKATLTTGATEHLEKLMAAQP